MVAIKDMEMPKGCRKCEYTPTNCSYCLRLHQAIPRDIFDTSRHPNCPLVEIEDTPHNTTVGNVVKAMFPTAICSPSPNGKNMCVSVFTDEKVTEYFTFTIECWNTQCKGVKIEDYGRIYR